MYASIVNMALLNMAIQNAIMAILQDSIQREELCTGWRSPQQPNRSRSLAIWQYQYGHIVYMGIYMALLYAYCHSYGPY